MARARLRHRPAEREAVIKTNLYPSQVTFPNLPTGYGRSDYIDSSSLLVRSEGYATKKIINHSFEPFSISLKVTCCAPPISSALARKNRPQCLFVERIFPTKVRLYIRQTVQPPTVVCAAVYTHQNAIRTDHTLLGTVAVSADVNVAHGVFVAVAITVSGPDMYGTPLW